MKMQCNVGKTDRMIRIVVGAVLLGIGLVTHIWLLSVLGVIPLATAVLRFCPAYTLIGFSSNKE